MAIIMLSGNGPEYTNVDAVIDFLPSTDAFPTPMLYSGISEQRPPSRISLLAFVERLALVGRFL